jgi:UDP-N-acetylmuramate dehydrogenase
VGELPSTLKTLLREFRLGGDLEVHERVDLGAWTTLAIGGLGDLLIRCSTASAGQRAIDLLTSHGLRWLVLGAGSRIVAPDRGLRVPLLHLAGELQRSAVEDGGVIVGAGAKLAQLSGSLARSGSPELDRLIGEPGSAGGDLRAAALGEPSALIDLAEWIEVARPGAGPSRVAPGNRGATWTAGLAEGRAVITRVRLRSGEPSPTSRSLRVGATRRPVGPLRGRVAPVVFLDPPGGSAATLLARAGCEVLRFGGARVADWSSNAIVTTPACSARDVAELYRMMRDRVVERCGVRLACRLWFLDEQGARVEP